MIVEKFFLPPFLQQIISKSLAKEPEHRYQSFEGLIFDLSLCLEHWFESAKLDVGTVDFNQRFEIPHRTYGRELELAELVSALHRSAAGTTEMLLIQGPSGIGKTMIVHELRGSIAAANGHFISGKFEQYHQNQPFLPITQAIGEILRGILAHSDAELDYWRKTILAALKENGKVLADVVPELELLTGPLQDVISLPPLEASNRLQIVFEAFFKAIATPKHPIVLFLDDLQWADSASLKLLSME